MEIVLTDEDKKELEDLSQKTNENKFIRVFIAAFGWGGPTFNVALEELKEGDVQVEHDGFTFIFEQELFNLLKKVEIDYVKVMFFSRFVVNAYQK